MATTSVTLVRGEFQARPAENARDMKAWLGLRARLFRGGAADDRDAFDARCRHLLVEPAGGGAPVAGLRYMTLPAGTGFAGSYAAQFYDIAHRRAGAGVAAEIGRFCMDPARASADAVRLLFGALTTVLQAERVAFLFGCASFAGADAGMHDAVLRHLHAHHALGEDWHVVARAPGGIALADLGAHTGDVTKAQLPALLRFYLAMGARVGATAITDTDLDTTHVFVALDVGRIPPGRWAALQALAAP